MTTYILYVKYALQGLLTFKVEVENNWDLFAIIGYLYSTSLEKIERIDYATIDHASEETLKTCFDIDCSKVKLTYQK